MKRQHSLYLDGIRGAAAFLVVIGHIESFWGVFTSGTEIYSQKSIWWQYYNKLCNGNFYVCIFFVLSGMVLIKNYDILREKEILQKAFVKRYFRLTPVVLSSVLLVWIIYSTVGFYNSGMAKIITHQWLEKQYSLDISLWDIIYNGFIGVYQGDSYLNGPLWTIYIEFTGSLILFLFANMFYERKNFHVISVFMCVLLIALLKTKGLYISLFIIGANIIKYRIKISVFFLIPALYLGTRHPWSSEIVLLKNTFPTILVAPDVISHAIAATLFIASVQGSQLSINFFEIKLFRWLGKISFCMYVYHVPVIMSIGCGSFIYFIHQGYGNYSGIFSMTLSFIFIFLLSELGCKYVDIPGQKLSSLISKKIIH